MANGNFPLRMFLLLGCHRKRKSGSLSRGINDSISTNSLKEPWLNFRRLFDKHFDWAVRSWKS